MKYFKVINQEDETDILYLSSSCDLDTARVVAERTRIADYGYTLNECSKEEFETMTQEVNDYIINVGQAKETLTPFVSAHTEEEAIQKADKLGEEWKCVEVVYMPQNNDDINEIIYSFYNGPNS